MATLKERRMQRQGEKRRKKSTLNKYVPGKNRTNSFTRRDKRSVFKLTIQSMGSIAMLTVQIIIVCLIGYAVVHFFGQRLSNTGEAMRPTLSNGEVVLVDRLAYNAVSPRRGHVVAFRPHGNENANIAIRRVVAVAGETIQIIEGRIYINEEEMSLPYFGEGTLYPGLAMHPITLEANEFFVIGDNHLGSVDSRMPDVGVVRRGDLYGRIWFSLGDERGFVR